jgi:membrane protease YdiL (CAAX protease family)
VSGAPAPDERQAVPEGPPPPGLRDAVLLSVLAWLASVMAAAPLIGWASPLTALAVGAVVGFGGIGTLVARQLPPPADARLGLRGFPPAFLGVLALLAVSIAILASELDNVVKALLSGVPPAAPTEPGEPSASAPAAWLLVEGVIVMVLLRPVVEEFFFRGVLLQGLVARYGSAAGIGITALLSAACEAFLVLPSGAVSFASIAAQGLFVGAVLGGVRLASGSLLAAVLLLAAMRAFGGVSVAFADGLTIPGFNAPGPHTPPAFLLLALAGAATGAFLARRAWRERQAGGNPSEGGSPDSYDETD